MSTSSLAGRRALVTGVSGNVGWGVAKALLEQGAQVVAVTRSQATAAVIQKSLDAHPALQVEIADMSDAASAFALRDRVSDGGALDHVVASLGSWWQKGAVVDQTPAEYAGVRAALLDGQVLSAMACLPLLKDRAGATYTLITGAAGHMSLPDTGLLVVAVSGVFGLSRMLRQEHAQSAVRVNEVLIQARIERAARPGVTTAEDFGRAVAKEMCGSARGMVLKFDGAMSIDAVQAH